MLTKLGPTHLRRPRLTSRFDDRNAEPSLLAVHGGPGTGKTALAAEIFQTRAADVRLWYELTSQDADAVGFVRSLGAELQRARCPVSKTSEAMIESLGEAGAAGAVGAICEDLASSGSSVLLVLDDLHRARSARTHEAIAALIRGLGGWGTLVLVGRELPPLETARLQLSGQADVVGDADLRFTFDEAGALWELLSGRRPPDDAIEAAIAATGGWPAGLVLLARRGSGGALPRAPAGDFLAAYFRDEVLASLEPDFVHKLMIAAFLPAWTTPNLVEIFGEAGAEAFEAGLEAVSTFVSRFDGTRQCQPLFREFLQQSFDKSSQLGSRTATFRHLALGSWADDEQRIDFWIRAQAWHEAAQATKRRSADWFRDGRHETVRQALARFPDKWKAGSAELLFVEGELARRDGRLAEAEGLLERALERSLRPDESPLLEAEILGSLAATRTARGEPDPDSARRALILLEAPRTPQTPASRRLEAFCQNVLGIIALGALALAEAEASFKTALRAYTELEDAAGLTRARHNLGLVAARMGDFKTALSHYRESIRQAEAATRLPLPLSYNNLALALLYLGRHQEAQDAASCGMALATRLGLHQDQVFLKWTVGMLELHLGELDRSGELFDASLEAALAIGDRHGAAVAHFGLAELALRRHDPGQARLQLEYGQERLGQLPQSQEIEVLHLQAEIALQMGRPGDALDLVERIRRTLEARPDSYRQFQVARVHEEALLALGRPSEADVCAQERDDLARRYGYALGDSRPEVDGEGPAPEVVVEALGKFEVRIGDRQLTMQDWRVSKARTLLMYLMTNPAGASKETLVSLLFGERDPGRSALHTIVGRLRNALEPTVEKGAASRFVLLVEGRYVFNPAIRTRCDVVDFERKIRQARVTTSDGERLALLADAVALYRGPFMAGAQEGDWTFIEAERLRTLAARAYEDLFVRAAEQDAWAELEALADASIAADPDGQLGYRMKLLAQAMDNRFADARRFGGILLGTLDRAGRPADPETVELVDRIRDETLTVRQARGFLPAR